MAWGSRSSPRRACLRARNFILVFKAKMIGLVCESIGQLTFR